MPMNSIGKGRTAYPVNVDTVRSNHDEMQTHDPAACGPAPESVPIKKVYDARLKQ
jgi:hypothetical protein